MIAERLTHVAPLGLRLWDDGAGAIAGDGLLVEAAAVTGPSTIRSAARAPSGCFVFHALPGLEAFTRGELGTDIAVAPAQTRRFQVSVSHPRGEFLPVCFRCDAPQWGFARPLVALRTVRPLVPVTRHAPAPSLPVFPAVSRPVRGGVAVVRASLSIAGGPPAASALIEASCGGTMVGRGLSDARGSVLLVFPFPGLDVLGQPGSPAPPPLTWELSFAVFHESKEAATHADLDAVMDFKPRRARFGGAGLFTDVLTQTLHPNQTLDLGAVQLKP